MEIDILDYLTQEIDGDVIYLPNRGNGGDALIAEGTYQVFERLGLKYSMFKNGNDYSGETILISGGGNLVQYYDYFENILLGLYKSAKRIIILPHTINYKDEMLSLLDSRVDIICRERVSYEYVSSAATGGARVFLADDMAFSIEADQLLNAGLFSKYLFLGKPGEIKQYISGLSEIKKYRQRHSSDQLNAFRIDCESANRTLPDANLDISALFLYGMKNRQLVRVVSSQIIRTLSNFDVINTDRLHLCIGALLTGKNVNFYGNSYYKNRAIYDYSVKPRSEKINYIE